MRYAFESLQDKGTDRANRMNFVKWYLRAMKLGFILADIGTQNNRFWSADNPLLLYEVPLHEEHVGA